MKRNIIFKPWMDVFNNIEEINPHSASILCAKTEFPLIVFAVPRFKKKSE